MMMMMMTHFLSVTQCVSVAGGGWGRVLAWAPSPRALCCSARYCLVPRLMRANRVADPTSPPPPDPALSPPRSLSGGEMRSEVFGQSEPEELLMILCGRYDKCQPGLASLQYQGDDFHNMSIQLLFCKDLMHLRRIGTRTSK